MLAKIPNFFDLAQLYLNNFHCPLACMCTHSLTLGMLFK
jgi:hypothetical protein